MSDSSKMNRRAFLGTAAAGLGASLLAGCAQPLRSAAPTALSKRRTIGANERINLAVIGTGGMARHHMRIMKQNHPTDINIIQGCDIYEPRYKNIKDFYPDARGCLDYREVLDNKDVDAVLIGSPEHWHHRHLIDTVQAGKDAYCEKPMGHTLKECEEMVKAVRKTDCIVQIGMQRRSTKSIIEAKKIYDSGVLGDVSLVRAWWYWNMPQIPKDIKFDGKIDWDRFQAPCAKKDHIAPNAARYNYWRYFWPYSGGNMTDQGTHLMDVIQWFANNSEPPLAAQEHGAVYGHPDWETPDVFSAVFEYPKFMATWTLSYNNSYEDGWGICFQGNKGTLLLDDDGAKLYAEPWKVVEGKNPEPPQKVAGGLDIDAHHTNFFDCVRSRKQPNATVEIGHRAVAGLHLANVAHFAKKRAELARDFVTTKV